MYHHSSKASFGPDLGSFARNIAGFGMGGPGPRFPYPGRARRGDIRTAVLRVLADEPMHGYQIIQELSARSGGTWNPSAGSVYPSRRVWPRPTSAVRALHRHRRPMVSKRSPPFRTYMCAGSAGQR